MIAHWKARIHGYDLKYFVMGLKLTLIFLCNFENHTYVFNNHRSRNTNFTLIIITHKVFATFTNNFIYCATDSSPLRSYLRFRTLSCSTTIYHTSTNSIENGCFSKHLHETFLYEYCPKASATFTTNTMHH
jgi:hypothetical protein